MQTTDMMNARLHNQMAAITEVRINLQNIKHQQEQLQASMITTKNEQEQTAAIAFTAYENTKKLMAKSNMHAVKNDADGVFHAVFGKWDEELGIIRSKDAQAERKDLSSVVRTTKPGEEAYSQITIAILEHVKRDDIEGSAYPTFEKLKEEYSSHEEKWKKYIEDYRGRLIHKIEDNKDSQDKILSEREFKLKQFCQENPEIFKEYANYISRKNQQLSVLELEIIACVYGGRIIYGSHVDGRKSSSTFNEKGKQLVSIYSHGENEFSRTMGDPNYFSNKGPRDCLFNKPTIKETRCCC